MRYGIAIPQYVADGSFHPPAVKAFLARAEALGFDSAWTSEQVVGTLPMVSPLELLAYAAACTERIRLGCSVLVSTLHSPLHLAKDLASLDQLSRGRLEVGVGNGGGFRAFAAFGVEGDSFVARFNEGLDLVRALWSEPRVDLDGRFWQLKGVAMEPKPFQKPGPPVWFGAGHPQAVRRAVHRADGFFGAGSATTAQFADQVAVARQALDDAGRDPATFGLAKRVYLAVDDDVDRARRTVTAGLHGLYDYFGLPDLTPVAVYGPPEVVADGLRAVIDAGAELIMLNPLAQDADQIERLATEVIPLLS